MPLATFYSVGSASIANGATTVSFAGAILGTADFPTIQAGDLFCDPAQPTIPPQRIASVDYTAVTATLAVNWPGTTMTGAAYEVRYVGDTVRSTAQTREVLTELSTVQANGRGLFYTFDDTTTDSDPGSGKFRFNNATIASATAAYLDNLDADGATASAILDTWDDAGDTGGRGQLWARSIATPSTFAAFNLTGSVVDGTGYRKLTLTYIGGSGALAAGDDIMVSFIPVGASGVDGTGMFSRVRAVSTSNITIATALNSGDAIDGVTLATNDLVLVTGQTTASENGVYVVGASPARDTSFDTYDEHPGTYFAVMEGTVYADTLWRCTSNKGGALGTTALVFSQYSSGLPTVGSRTALKALNTATITTAVLTEAGREGTFNFRSGDYSALVAADTQEGVFVKATAVASSSGAWVREVDASVKANWFGVVGDGTTDDTSALQGAITVAELLGRTLQYGDGNFKITTALSTAKSIRHLGTGPLTSVIKPAGTITAFSHDGAQAPTFESLGVDYASAASSGTAGFNITSTSGEAGYFHAWNVRVHNAYDAFNFVKASQWVVDGCEIIDSVQAGFFIQNTNNVDSGDSTIVNNLIYNPTATGSTNGIIWRSSGGLRICNNKINNFQYGIQVQLASGATTGDILITGNSIEAVGFSGVAAGIQVERLGTTGTLHSVLINGNQLNGWATGIQVPLDATGPWLTELTITGNDIYGNAGAAASGIIVHSTTGFAIVGNTLRSGAAGSTPITTGSSAADGMIAANSKTGSWNANSISSSNTKVIDSTTITGALGANDNRLLRADGTGGTAAQGSAVTVDDSGNVSGVGTLGTTGVVTVGASSGGTYNGNTHFSVSDQFPSIQWLSGSTGKTQLICNVNDASMYFDAAGGFNIRDSLNGTTVLGIAPSLITASKPLKFPSYTVATLPAAGTVGAGATAYVTDSNATTYNATVAGGGSNKLKVTSDGTNWKIG
jgi:hypothetical protein